MPEEIQLSNTPKMNIDKLVDYLAAAYCTLILKGLPIKKLPPPMLWGPPGVGKSQMVRQVAKIIESKTGKKVVITDVRLLLYNPIDLRGIPVANTEKDAAVWLKPFVFQMDDSQEVINILLLDEITAAPQSVQAAGYQLTLDRTIGEHKLPDNCIVMAAGNRTTDKSIAYKMPKALANRLMHFDILVSFDSWKKWAISNGINEKIIGFLSFRQDYLMAFNSSNDDLAFATPRSWEMASNILNNISDDVLSMQPLLSGVLGIGVVSEFCTWVKVYKDLPKVSDIFAGKCDFMPKNSDALYALVSSMSVYAREHRNDIEKIKNSIVYAMKLPADFSAVLMKDYIYLEKGYKNKLMQIPEFLKWFRLRGGNLNGIV